MRCAKQYASAQWPRTALAPLLVAGLAFCAAAGGRAAEPVAVRDIGDRRELFVDDWLIDTLRGVTLRLHPAVPREVALPLDQPWAGSTVGFTAVFKDGDRYRLYYTSDSDGQRPDYPILRTWPPPRHAHSLGTARSRVPGLHYKRRSGLSRSGSWSCRAARMRACSALGRATRRRANCWPAVVSRRMSPIWMRLSSRSTTAGVMGRGFGEALGRRGSGLRISVISPARLRR